MHETVAIMRRILDGYALPVHGDHGVVHWARVRENGLWLAERTGARAPVVSLFALFHDARRINEYRDDGHGLRGAELARSLRGSLVDLADEDFELLYEACRDHTGGRKSPDATIQACWDADRLDLGRVGIAPDPRRLGSDAARARLAEAHEKAVRGYEPPIVSEVWGL